MFYAAIQNEKDRTKVEKLYYEYRKLMYKEAYAILEDKTLAEDAVSESFIRIINNLHKIDENICPRTRNFLVIICRNVAKDIYNSKRNNIPYEHTENITNPINVEDIVINRETVKRITDIISAMDSMYRDVLILRRAYGMSREDISKIFGISVETVKKRLLRANNMIKAKLEKEDVR